MKNYSNKAIKFALIISVLFTFLAQGQSKVEDFFKSKGVSLIAKLAHPTNTYQSGYYQVNENKVLIEIDYQNSKMNLVLQIENGYITDIAADDNDWLPPFFAIEMIKDYIVQSAFESDDENKIISQFENFFKTSLIKMTGEQVACVALTLSLTNYNSDSNVEIDPKFKKYISLNKPYWYPEWKRYERISNDTGDDKKLSQIPKEALIHRLTRKHLIKVSECAKKKADTRPELKGKLKTKAQLIDFLDHRSKTFRSCDSDVKDYFKRNNVVLHDYLFEPYIAAFNNVINNTDYFKQKVNETLNYNASSYEVYQLIEKYKNDVLSDFINTTSHL